jgi:hypothetical protein
MTDAPLTHEQLVAIRDHPENAEITRRLAAVLIEMQDAAAMASAVSASWYDDNPAGAQSPLAVAMRGGAETPIGQARRIARTCHEANRALCAAFGDMSQLPWDDAPQWQRDSAVKGVEFIRANPDAPPSANHESWSAQKVADGWVYGEAKNPDATPPTHPCLVPFEQLPPEQQAKDFVFGAIARAMLQA